MKNTLPGSADSGRVPAKIFNLAVGPFYSRRQYRLGLSATILENNIFWADAILRVLTDIGTIAGGNFVSYPLAICIKKNQQNEEYICTVFCGFLTIVVGISPPPTLPPQCSTFRRFFY
jgi:hypothetical protein